MANKATIKSLYESGEGKRETVLERARELAALTKPWVLPPSGQSQDTSLPENYQSVGSQGVSAIVGKMLVALWTPGTPWFQHKPSAAILHDPNVPAEQKRALQSLMLSWDMTILSVLESNNISRNRGMTASFRSRKRTTLDQLVITGDSLERMDDDFRIQVYRRDQYITCRDSAGEVLEHVIKERVDPESLVYNGSTGSVADGTNGEFYLKTNLPLDLKEKPAEDRMVDLFTHVEWQAQSKKWLVRQEVNDIVFVESEETVSPFFSTAFNLSPGENYGRGIVEENHGTLRTLDETEHRQLELIARIAKGLVVKDENSLMRDSDLEKPSGEVIHGRVRDGKCQDVAMLGFDESRDFQIMNNAIDRKEASLGRAFLLESAAQPEGERVTATQIRRIATEIDSALGGAFAPIAEQQQLPLLARTVHLLKRKKMLPNFPEKAVDVQAITGIAALNRDIEFAKAVELGTLISQFPEAALNRIDWSVYAEKLFELRAFNAPGIVKTDQQLQQEQAAAQQAALAAQAGAQAIESTGKIAESAAQQQPQGG